MFDGGNIKVGVQVEQEVDLIWKVVHPVEPQVGHWVGSGGFAFLVMQIDLGWVVVEEVGLG